MDADELKKDFENNLRSELEILKERKKLASRRLKQLLKQKSHLSSINQSLSEKADASDAHLEKLKDAYISVTNNAKSDTDKMVAKLGSLNQVIQDMLSIHTTKPVKGEEVFPSRLNPSNYFKNEEEFTSSLTAYTKRQFFEGIAEMAGAKDKLRYEIMEVSNPESLLIKGESEEVMKNKCKELARLQSVYTKSQTIRSESHCSLRKIQASLYKIEENLSKIPMEIPVLDVGLLSSTVTNLQQQCEEKGREMKRVFEEDFAPLVEEMSELQSAKILSGNFDLKIARQNYFMSKQDTVIDQLLLQNSRYELLSMLYEVEAKAHRDTYHLLSTAKSLLGGEKSSLDDRLSEMLPHSQKKPPRETLDSRDSFMQNIYQALESEESRSTQKHFITCEMLKQNFEEFMSRSKRNVESDTTDDSNDGQVVERLRRQFKECAAHIHEIENPHRTADGQEKISHDIAKIEDVLVALEKSVKGAITDIDRKKKLLVTDSLKALDRTIFPNFFNDPTRLQRIMAELRTRVEAIEK